MSGFDDVIFSNLTTSLVLMVFSILSLLKLEIILLPDLEYYVIRLSNNYYNSEVKSCMITKWNVAKLFVFPERSKWPIVKKCKH